MTATDQDGTPAHNPRDYHLRTAPATSNTNWWAAFAKTYLDGDGNYHYIYADDLQVWDGIP